MDYGNIDGHISDSIYIRKGFYQGSTLSLILFNLVAQISTRELENTTEIKGIQINGMYILLSFFADVTDLFIHSSIECLETII